MHFKSSLLNFTDLMGEEKTSPASPGIPNTSQDDLAVIFDDEVDEVIDVPESEDQVYN